MPEAELALQMLGYGVVVPAVVALAGLFLALRLGKLTTDGSSQTGEALALGLGLLAGYVAFGVDANLARSFLAPTSARHWLPLLSLLAVTAGLFEGIVLRSPLLRWSVRVAVAAVTGWLLVRGEPVHSGWSAVLGGAVLVFWGLLDGPARKWSGASVPLLLLVTACAAAMVLELAGNLALAQMAGVLAAVLGSAAVVAWWGPGATPVRGAVPAVAVLLPGLLFEGYAFSFSAVPLASFLLVAAAPVALGLLRALPLPGRSRRAIRVAVVLVPLGVAIALAACAEAS